MTTQEEPRPEAPAREPVFNIAAVVVALILTCGVVHALRVYALSPQQDFELLVRTAFIPIRYSGDFDIDIYAFTSPLTYSLLHGDAVHLTINMIWLAAFGSPLANRLGALKFLFFWAITSLGAVLLHYLVHMDGQSMVIGASGTVSGMMAAAARFGFAVDRRRRKPAFTGRILSFQNVLRRRNVVVFLTVWFIVNLIAGLGFLIPGESRSIAWEAHIGGFLAGFIAIDWIDRWPRPTPDQVEP